MTYDPSRSPEYEKNTKEQYEALGRFVEAFESMVHEVRTICVQLLSRGHRDPTFVNVNHTLLNIAFSHNVLTARPLFDIMRAMIAEILNNEAAEAKKAGKEIEGTATFLGVLQTITGTYGDLVTMRNNLLHGTWFVGYSGPGNDGSASEFFIHKYAANKHGLAALELPKKTTEILDLVELCIRTKYWISILHGCLAFSGVGLDIKKSFRRSGEKWVRVAPNGDETLPRISLAPRV